MEDNPEFAAWDIEGFVETESVVLSESDLKDVQESKRCEAISTAMGKLKQHKELFEWAVNELIEGELITDGMAAQKFRELYGKRNAKPAKRRKQ